jgi:hypothetical protein
MRYNPKTNRFESTAQSPTPPKNEISDYWIDNTRDDIDSRLNVQKGLDSPIREGKDSPMRRRSTPTQMTRQPATATPAPTGDPLAGVFEQYGDDPVFAQLISTLFGSGGSGGSGGPSRANRQRAARTARQAGRQAKRDYTRLGNEGFDRTMAAADTYYSGRESTARQQINDATTAFLQSLVAPTAYADMPLPSMNVQEQGLMEALGAYGATGDLARQQRTSDQGNLDFASQLASRTAGQLNTAQTNYLNAIRNAGVAGQADALTNLTQNVESMRGLTRTQAEAVRQGLIQQGIEALISGNQNAANAYL